jgi:hypothetical protein
MSLVREKNTTKKEDTQMTRKDYIKIAEALNAAAKRHSSKEYGLSLEANRLFTLIVNELSLTFADDNPRFSLGRFEKAVTGFDNIKLAAEQTEKPDAVDRLEVAMDEYRKAVA